jgi:hypothetical protein
MTDKLFPALPFAGGDDPEAAHVILWRRCVHSYDRDTRLYDRETYYVVRVCHSNPNHGEVWASLFDGHEADATLLIAKVFRCDGTEWFQNLAFKTGLWLDGEFVPANVVRRALRMVELTDGTWVEDERDMVILICAAAAD